MGIVHLGSRWPRAVSSPQTNWWQLLGHRGYQARCPAGHQAPGRCHSASSTQEATEARSQLHSVAGYPTSDQVHPAHWPLAPPTGPRCNVPSGRSEGHKDPDQRPAAAIQSPGGSLQSPGRTLRPSLLCPHHGSAREGLPPAQACRCGHRGQKHVGQQAELDTPAMPSAAPSPAQTTWWPPPASGTSGRDVETEIQWAPALAQASQPQSTAPRWPPCPRFLPCTCPPPCWTLSCPRECWGKRPAVDRETGCQPCASPRLTSGQKLQARPLWKHGGTQATWGRVAPNPTRLASS